MALYATRSICNAHPRWIHLFYRLAHRPCHLLLHDQIATQAYAFGVSKTVRASSAVSSLEHCLQLNVRDSDRCMVLPQFGHATI
jgi:hypothetical protein